MKAIFKTACGARQTLDIQDIRPSYFLPLRRRFEVGWHTDVLLPPRGRDERRFDLEFVDLVDEHQVATYEEKL